MDLEQTAAAALGLENEQLRQENDQLKSMLSVVQENVQLRAKMQSFNNDTLKEFSVSSASRTKSSSQCQTTCDERQFQKALQQTKLKHKYRTSSPVRSLFQSSPHTDINKEESQSGRSDLHLDMQGLSRLFGEIAYQLDQRILSYVFKGQKRLYGFTVVNIPDKIIEVSTHPLTGKADEGYRLYLTQRYADLMERLHQLGYKATLHPLFTEIIINTYGILKARPSEYSSQEIDFKNPGFLKRLIMTTAPRKLQTDLVAMLACLCSMAQKDKRPLLLW